MKSIKTHFRRDGIDCLQVKRSGAVCIYELSKPHWTRKSYEVVIVRGRGPRKADFGRGATLPRPTTFEAQEHYPPTAQWGQQGWSFMDLDGAEGKCRELVKKQAQPK